MCCKKITVWTTFQEATNTALVELTNCFQQLVKNMLALWKSRVLVFGVYSPSTPAQKIMNVSWPLQSLSVLSFAYLFRNKPHYFQWGLVPWKVCIGLWSVKIQYKETSLILATCTVESHSWAPWKLSPQHTYTIPVFWPRMLTKIDQNKSEVISSCILKVSGVARKPPWQPPGK